MTKPLPTRPGKGYRAHWTRCSHGHHCLQPDPRDPAHPLRRCNTCARIRAQAADAVNHAAALLSLSRVDYVSVYGTKGSTALRLIAALEAEALATSS